MKKILLFAFALMAAVAIQAANTTFLFPAVLPNGWTTDMKTGSGEAGGRGVQFTTSGKLTYKGVKNVTRVVVACSSNFDGNTLAVAVGNKKIGATITFTKESENKEYTFASATPVSGDLVITITRNDKSVYVSKVVITGDAIEEKPVDTGLDDNYVYGDSVEIFPKDSLGKIPNCDTIVNNILLQLPNGAFYKTDIRAAAGSSLTLTATRNIKAVAIDGVVKKGFTATASSGKLTYKSNSEGEAKGTPVVLVKDVDQKSLTLNVSKQLQCQRIAIYFEANPDIEIEGGYSGHTGDSDTIRLTTLNAIEYIYYEEYSKAGAHNYYVSLYDETDAHKMPCVSLDLYTAELNNLTGDYSAKNGTLGAEYTKVYYFDTENASIASEGEVSITCNSTTHLYTISGTIVTTNGYTFIFEVTAMAMEADPNYPSEPLSAHSLTPQFPTVIVANYAEDYNMVYIYAENATDTLSLMFVGNQMDANGFIPAGTYSIKGESELKDGEQNYFTAGYYDDIYGVDGALLFMGYDLYYFVSGTITITAVEGGYTYSIDAVSAHGSTLKTNIFVPLTADIEEVVFERNARSYDIMGREVDSASYKGIVIQNGCKFVMQ